MALPKLKKSERTAALLPPWHPNFRNYERLPDVKVVRTSFFVNGVAVVVALAMLSYFVMQEYRVRQIHGQTDDLQRQIDANHKASEQAVQLYQKFQDQEKKVAEAEAFVKSDFVFSSFIIELGQTLPKNMALDYIDVHDDGVTLHGIVQGTSDEALGAASAYIDQLRANPRIGPRFESISFPQNGLTRGLKAGEVDFVLFMKSKKAPKS